MSDDLISRQAAIDAIENTECELLPEEWDELTDAIMNLPSADVVERKKGKWEDVTIGRWIYAKCSVCGTVHDVQSSFCPNCGAEMEGTLWNSLQ